MSESPIEYNTELVKRSESGNVMEEMVTPLSRPNSVLERYETPMKRQSGELNRVSECF